MPYLFEFDYNDGDDSQFHGHFKMIVAADSSLIAKQKATEIILDATEKDDEFFESGSKIWLKNLLFIKEGFLNSGIIYDFIEDGSSVEPQSFPRESVAIEYTEGKEGKHLDDLEPFLIIP
jgi:hypothetical protein